MPVDPKPDTFETIFRRRAVRSFKPDALDRGTIVELLNAAVQAPTAMHLEPWAFAVIQDRDRLHRYSDQAKAALLETKAELGIPAEGAAVAPIIVGIPSALPAPTSRKAPEVLRWL